MYDKGALRGRASVTFPFRDSYYIERAVKNSHAGSPVPSRSSFGRLMAIYSFQPLTQSL